jgi:hypothetical protein
MRGLAWLVAFGGGFSSLDAFASIVQLGELNGTNGFVINGIDPGDSSGSSVAGAGDVNGDGFADILIGASGADPNGNSAAGETYVVFGKVTFTGSLDLSTLDGTNGFVINGVDPSDFSGSSVAGAGDVNGDGFADILIGAPRADPNGNFDAGKTYVVFGIEPPSPPPTPPPSPRPRSPPLVLTIALTVFDFNQAAQDALAAKIATFLGIELRFVSIAGVTAASVNVEASVYETASSGADVSAAFSQTSLEDLSTTLGVTVEAASVRKTNRSPPPPPGGGGGGCGLGASTQTQDSLDTTTFNIIGACVGGVLSLGLAARAIYYCRSSRARKPVERFEPVEPDEVPVDDYDTGEPVYDYDTGEDCEDDVDGEDEGTEEEGEEEEDSGSFIDDEPEESDESAVNTNAAVLEPFVSTAGYWWLYEAGVLALAYLSSRVPDSQFQGIALLAHYVVTVEWL